MVLDICVLEKNGLWNGSLLDGNLFIAADVSGSSYSHRSTHLSLFTPYSCLSQPLVNIQTIDLLVHRVEVSVTDLWFVFQNGKKNWLKQRSWLEEMLL